MTPTQIGHVDVRSGTMAILDFGLMRAFGANPPAIRASLTTALAGTSSELRHQGVVGVVIRGISAGRYPVVSEAIPDGELEGLRKRVVIELSDGQPAERAIELGSVLVDMARIGIFDASTLEHWNESRPADGKADIAFWGGDQDEVAKRLGAPPLDDVYGFADLPYEEARQIGLRLDALRKSGELAFAFDFRPHTHPYFLLSQIRAATSEAGVIELDGCAVCGFMTTWGDGMFPVRLEVGTDDRPLRCVIELATEEAIENLREVNS